MAPHGNALTPDTIAKRIHDDVLQSLGAGMLQLEMCRRLLELDRASEVRDQLNQTHASLDQAVLSLRSLLQDLKQDSGFRP